MTTDWQRRSCTKTRALPRKVARPGANFDVSFGVTFGVSLISADSIIARADYGRRPARLSTSAATTEG